MKSTSNAASAALRLVAALVTATGLGCSGCPGGTGDPPPSCASTCDDGNPCTTDTCDANGGCLHTPADGTACDDGNACTLTDTCQGGVCTGGDPVACAASDACHAAGTCDPGTGTCSSPAMPDGTSCDDGNACTRTDACESGLCRGGDPVVCTATDQCHTAGTCDPDTGTCSSPTAPEGTACDDGNACTQTDTCLAGACVGSSPVTCTALDQCHMAGTCDPTSGSCNNPTVGDGTPCNDGNLCTQTDACVGGTCLGGNPVTCAALDQCHVPGTCSPATGKCDNPTMGDGTPCNDGNLCTQTDACSGGTCVGGNPVACAALDQCHLAGSCNPASGTCSNPAKGNGVACDDGNACTTGDTCQGGTCTGGAPPDCSDSNACTVDNCDPASGCTHAPVTCIGSGSCSGACTDTVAGCATYVCPDPLGCTIGYWKNHPTSWVGYAPGDLLGQVAGVVPAGVFTYSSTLSGLAADPYTLSDALAFHGGSGLTGGAQILCRQAVAALLNASSTKIAPGFPFKQPQDVIDAVNAALQSNDRSTMLALAQELDDYNNASGGGCPLN